MSVSPRFDARLRSVAVAFPDHPVDQEATIKGLLALFPREDPGFVRTIVERSGVERRLMALPPDGILRERSFTVRQAEYREIGERIAFRACVDAIEKSGIAADEIDAIIDVSCTGVLIPALDVHLAPRLGLRSDVHRYPITESGCAAGALALGLATRLAHSGLRVLVLAVELCSLSLVKDDAARSNLVAGVLFGDGAAAAVVAPDGKGPRIRGIGSHLFPETSQIMGFDVGTHGLKLVLLRELPVILERHLKPAVDAFLSRNGTSMDKIGRHFLHTGGRRVLESYAELFGLAESDLSFSWEALRKYGNLSSAAILSVLELALSSGKSFANGKEALVTAFGPGLSAEMLLLEDAKDS